MLLGVYPELTFSFKEGKTVDRYNFDTALSPTRSVTWRLASIVAAAFFAISASAEVEADTSLTNRIVCTTAPVSYNAEGNPARVFVSGDFVFVLEQWNARIAVYDLAGRTNLFYYGATQVNGSGLKYTGSDQWKISNGDGGFKKPFGMAFDPSSGNRFAVADSGNNRVQLFTFDQSTGEITFVAASGKIFDNPTAVAFTETGDILVADSGNCRVVRLSSALAQTAEYPLGEKANPTGICSDSDTSEGFWITDAKNQRVAYYRIADGTATPAVSFGTIADKEFVTPRDVQIFDDSDNGKFLCVVDNQGSRVRIVEAVFSGGAYTEVVAVGDVGSYSDPTLQEYEKLWRPNGVFVDDGVLYVADYGHNLIKWYNVVATSPEPPEPPKYFHVTYVKLYDTNNVAKTEFELDEPIRLEIGYETDDEIDLACFSGCLGDDWADPKRMDRNDGVLACDNAGLTDRVGAIDIRLTVFGAEDTFMTNFFAALTVTEPPQPAEEYEEAGWHIDTFTVTNGTATLTWAMPANALPSDGKCDFRIDWRTSLTEGAWSTSPNSYMVEDVTTAAGCTKTIQLSGIRNPSAAFFRLFWTNKVKGVAP